MDEPDTYKANVGRHRETQPRLVRAKTYPHLVFADPPASPDRETSRSPREQRAASHPPPQERPPRDQRQIDRMERETMVLYPTLQPNPVMPKRARGNRDLNWRAEGLRVQPSRN